MVSCDLCFVNQAVLRCGCDVWPQLFAETPLMVAASHGHLPAVQWLMGDGRANIRAVNVTVRACVHAASAPLV